MYRKILVGGMTAAAILGAGGTALALTGANAATDGTGKAASSTATGSPRAGHANGRARLFKHLSHGQIVTQGKNGFVTHDFIKGTVTAVSATSITVQAADKTSETFVVNKATKVRLRSAGKGTASSIGKVAKGDQVILGGTGSSTRTAKRIVDVKK
jgi:hypothetical protein